MSFPERRLSWLPGPGTQGSLGPGLCSKQVLAQSEKCMLRKRLWDGLMWAVRGFWKMEQLISWAEGWLGKFCRSLKDE